MGGSTGRMHIGRIKDNAIHCAILIRQITAINTVLYVSCEKVIFIGGYAAPEYAFAKGDICDSTPGCNIQT